MRPVPDAPAPPPSFPPALDVQPCNNPGYHTCIPAGQPVRHTRENAQLALRLLSTGNLEDRGRAREILEALLAAQDSNPSSPTYGIWPWYFEEPIDAMKPPDFNWADFIGGTLLTLLRLHHTCLPPHLLSAVQTALFHAAECIRRRDIGPHYTNIAIMGATVTAGAGELLGNASLLDYGRARFARFHAYTLQQGTFNEYNSPNYTLVALREIERAIMLLHDSEIQRVCRALHRIAWQSLATFFHPGTRQLAGPQSRAYSDHLTPEAAEMLSARLDFPLPAHDTRAARPSHSFGTPPQCPADLQTRFRALPSPEVIHRQALVRRADGQPVITGTTWMDEVACLGTVDFESLWAQRRPVLAYWRTPDDSAIVLRFRCLRDGRDWASAALHSAQAGPKALVVVGTVRDGGDYHLMLDRPAHGLFPTRELLFQWSLAGKAVAGCALGPDLWKLSAGNTAVIIRTRPAAAAGLPLLWELESRPGIVRLKVRLTFEPALPLNPRTLAPQIASALKIIHGEPIVPPETLVWESTSTGGRWICGDLSVPLPLTCPSYRTSF